MSRKGHSQLRLTLRRSHGALVFAMLALLVSGCVRGPVLVSSEQQKPLDRSISETPAGMAMTCIAEGLTAPTAFCFDLTEGEHKGTKLIAESGVGGSDPRIYGITPDARIINIYPQGRSIPFLHRGFEVYAPIGGMVVVEGKILVSHRDHRGMGVITAFSYDGSHSTVVADLPAQGDYSVTDIALNPVDGRIYFGVGAATNSGVVGIDNWQIGWVNDYPRFCDLPMGMIKLLGYRFDTKNPKAGLWGGADIAVTAPFQPFNSSNQTRVSPAPGGKPSSAIYSCSPGGGDLRVEAHGIRLPRGIAIDNYGQAYFTNNGMEMRGTRPVKDDPDALLKLTRGTWYGFPDYTADLNPSSDPRYQPPVELILPFGYPELSSLLDNAASSPSLQSPTQYRTSLVYGAFPSQSGAAKFAIVPETGPFKEFAGEAIVALSGDRAPFATSGRKLVGPIGYKVVVVNLDRARKPIRDFVRNTSGMPASMLPNEPVALERPVDVKFGPDGALYILDFGRMTVANGKEKVSAGTGRIFRVAPIEAPSHPTTAPTTSE